MVGECIRYGYYSRSENSRANFIKLFSSRRPTAYEAADTPSQNEPWDHISSSILL
jgi:hypothetical protein